MTQSGYLRLTTKVLFSMGTKYAKLHFCHGISEHSKDKIFSLIEYDYRTVYGLLIKPFMGDCDSTALNLPSMPIDDSFRPKIISCYTTDIIPYDISVASVNSVVTFTTPSYFPQFILLTSESF